MLSRLAAQSLGRSFSARASDHAVSLPAGDYYVVCVITWKDILVGTTAHWERDPTVTPTQVVNLGTRVHLRAGERIAVNLDQVSRHRALIEPPTLGEEKR